MLRSIPKRLLRLPAVNPLWLVLGAGLWLAGLPNTALWQALTSAPIRQAGGWAVAAVLFVVIVATCVVLVAPLAYTRWVRPVLALLPWTDEPDLLAQCNDNVYGLAAGIWTRDYPTAWRLGAALQTGILGE